MLSLVKKVKEVLKLIWGILVEMNPFTEEAIQLRKTNRNIRKEQNIIEYYERPQEFKLTDSGKLQRHNSMSEIYKLQ